MLHAAYFKCVVATAVVAAGIAVGVAVWTGSRTGTSAHAQPSLQQLTSSQCQSANARIDWINKIMVNQMTGGASPEQKADWAASVAKSRTWAASGCPASSTLGAVISGDSGQSNGRIIYIAVPPSVSGTSSAP